MDIYSKTINVEELKQNQINNMFDLMNFHYVNTIKETFEKDLMEKDLSIMLYDTLSHELVGFSTQVFFKHYFNGKNITVLFSSDTIIKPEYWGSIKLPLAFGQIMLDFLKTNNENELYWMLISKGVRTYKFLPVFFNDFYPCYQKATPPNIKTLMDELGNLRYSNHYDAEKGIIKALDNGQYLKKEYHPDINRKRPNVAFFFEKKSNLCNQKITQKIMFNNYL